MAAPGMKSTHIHTLLTWHARTEVHDDGKWINLILRALLLIVGMLTLRLGRSLAGDHLFNRQSTTQFPSRGTPGCGAIRTGPDAGGRGEGLLRSTSQESSIICISSRATTTFNRASCGPLTNAYTSALKNLDLIPQFKATANR
jgi:hypothetical protein